MLNLHACNPGKQSEIELCVAFLAPKTTRMRLQALLASLFFMILS